MALDNLISVSFSAEDLIQIDFCSVLSFLSIAENNMTGFVAE
jgi:hypothetical protein